MKVVCVNTQVNMVGVAQLVEHLVVVQEVAGSSPVTHPNKTLKLLNA